jgi:RNA polymerase sigma factor (sigma-70 family)
VEFRALFERYHAPLYRYVHRLTGDADLAEDVAQEAFVRLLRNDVPAAEARPWLFTVATNLVRDSARSTARRSRLLAGATAGGSDSPHPDDAVLRREQQAAVRAALERLPERDRRMLLMRAEGFAYREIAAVIDVAESSVGTLVARALRRLEAALAAPEPAHAVREADDDTPG